MILENSNEIKWLHISDLHFDSSKQDHYDSNKVIKPLLNTVEKKKPDLIFVTGDIGCSGRKEDYDLAKDFFIELLEKSELTSDQLWIVPGNHDVNREACKFLTRTITNEALSRDFFNNHLCEHREPYLKRFENYKNFLEILFPDREFVEGDVVHKPSVLNINNVSLGILPLNSAWFCQDDNDQGKLWIGVRTIQKRVEYLKKQKPSPDIIIALLHHPLSYLHEEERANDWLQKDANIILRGHLHRGEAQSISSYTSKVIEITAGATYQGSDKPCRSYFATLNTKTFKLQLEPYFYVDSPHATRWILDTSVFPVEEKGYIEEIDLSYVLSDEKRKMLKVNTHEKEEIMDKSEGSKIIISSFSVPPDGYTDALDLSDFFDSRYIKDELFWNNELQKRVKTFFARESLKKLSQDIYLYFTCHLSIAFLAGTLINPKVRDNVCVVPMQKKWDGPDEPWRKGSNDDKGKSLWKIDEFGTIDTEVMIGISVTSPVENHLVPYREKADLNKLPLILFQPVKGTGKDAVPNGTYAWQLGYELDTIIRTILLPSCKTIHLFMSAPVALAYIFGNTLLNIDQDIQLYEHDWEGKKYKDKYYPSIKIVGSGS